VSMQSKLPLTLTLSPSDGAKEHISSLAVSSLFGEHLKLAAIFSLSPSDGERVGVRGNFDCIVTAKSCRAHGVMRPVMRFMGSEEH
jgi:hypothetical protein